MSRSGASRKIHWAHISQHQKTYLYSRMVFSNADKTTSNSVMSLAFFPSRHQILTESEVSRISREVNLIYWFYFGSRPRVLKAYNKLSHQIARNSYGWRGTWDETWLASSKARAISQIPVYTVTNCCLLGSRISTGTAYSPADSALPALPLLSSPLLPSTTGHGALPC